MKKSCALVIFSVLIASVFAGSKPRSTFAQKDIFQTACFLKNVSGLIPSYKGKSIQYYADHDGVTVYFTDEGPIYKLIQKDEKRLKEIEREKTHKHKEEVEEEEGMPTRISYTTQKWTGANTHPVIEAIGKSKGYYTFLAGTTATDYNSIITSGYTKLVYHDIYPGIDVEYSFPDVGGMKYDFVIHPGADPNIIQIEYSGAVKKIIKDQDGNITIHTETGDFFDHAPVAYSERNRLACSYEVHGTGVSFSLTSDYDHGKILVIDPWVTALTQLTVRNLGADVDYDLAGNVYVYGAGGTDPYDAINFHKVAKYDPNGNFLWVFMGSVGTANWSTIGATNGNSLSDAKVDKLTNRVYVGQSTNLSGARAIRLNSAGVYDGFIATAGSTFRETWSFIKNCSTGSMLILGGSTSYNQTIGIIDSVSGVITANNITGLSTLNQDVVSAAYDEAGNLYVVMASNITTQVNNAIFKVNSADNGYVWTTPTGYNSFKEAANLPAFNVGIAGSTNHFNALAANGSYLYYYDGYNLKAFNLANGNVVGALITISGNDTLWQGGIAVDNCNNVYIGGKGMIKAFTFDGNSFVAGADILLGAAFSGNAVNDIRYNQYNNLLYVAGSGIVGTYTATLSSSCDALDKYNISVVPGCNGAIVNVSPQSGLINPFFAYEWRDSTGSIVRQTDFSATLSDTLSNISQGQYTIQVQLKINCSGYSVNDTFHTAAATLDILPSDTTIVEGNPLQLSSFLNSYLNSGSIRYLWTPSAGLSCTDCPNPILLTDYLTDSFNVYMLKVTYNTGCTVVSMDTVRMQYIQELAIPTAFTPNGDGKNDMYFILAKGVKAFNMNVYNRWGGNVFSSTDINVGWDGNYHGEPQPTGEYLVFFSINYQNGRTENHEGTLTLLR